MNQEKISRAIELQNRANDQIETYGEALDSTVNELMNIIDNMTPEEEMNSQPSIWQHNGANKKQYGEVLFAMCNAGYDEY